MTPSRGIRLFAILLVLACTAGCDQATKHFARAELSLHSATLPGGFVEFTLAENPGAFLSFGASIPEIARGTLFTIGVSLGLILLLGYLVRESNFRWLSFLGLVMVWAGGMSNLFDRFTRHGLVTDFMVVRIGPLHTGVFNLADVVIMGGIAIVLVSISRRKSEAHRENHQLPK
jgi:signal peptidase II